MSQDRNAPLVMPATLDECELVMERLSADCNSVRDQLDEADQQWRAKGKTPDPLWYRRARSAWRWMSRDRQRLQEHMAKLRKAAKVEQKADHDRALIAALREHVSAEVFQACVSRVHLQLGGEA